MSYTGQKNTFLMVGPEPKTFGNNKTFLQDLNLKCIDDGCGEKASSSHEINDVIVHLWQQNLFRNCNTSESGGGEH